MFVKQRLFTRLPPLISATDYSQCLPGAPSGSSGGSSSGGGSGLPFLGGVNTAGYDFTVVCLFLSWNNENTEKLLQATDGSFTGTGVSPPAEQFTHFANEGVNIFRIREFVVRDMMDYA